MVIPDPKLPEPAMPWGRQLTQKTVDLEQQVGRLDNDTNNNLQQLNSSVQLLSQQVSSINDVVNQLAINSATTAQVNALATVPAISTGTNNTFNLNTGYQTLISLSFAVPAGFTQAVVTTTGFVACGSTSGGSYVNVLTTIHTFTGDTTQAVMSAVSPYMSCPNNTGVILNGMSGVFGCTLQARLTAGTSTGLLSSSQLTVNVTYRR